MIDGVTVEAARIARKWARRELAERSGLTEASIYTIEKKGRNPKPTEKVALAAAFGWDYHGRPLPQPMPEWVDAPAVDEPEPPAEPEPPVARMTLSGAVAKLAGVPVLVPSGLQAVVKLAAEHEQAAVREALLRPQPPDGPIAEEGVRLVSHSELRTFKACRRRWWLEWRRGLRPKVESPFGVMAVGNRIHQALALYYTPAGVGSIDPATALELLIVKDWTALTERIGTREELRKEFDKEANLERAMVTGYIEWLANTGADADLEVIAPETYVEYSLGHMTPDYEEVRLIGRLDVRVRRITDGSAMFIDHKTVANFTTPAKTLKLDEQMLHYHLLERRGNDLAMPRSDGALYNMLRRVKRTPRAQPPFYERVPVRHNDHEIESYALRTAATIRDILEVERHVDHIPHGQQAPPEAYPRPSRECSWCPFFEVCPMFDDGSRAEDMIAARYQAGDPLDYYRVSALAGDADQGTEETG